MVVGIGVLRSDKNSKTVDSIKNAFTQIYSSVRQTTSTKKTVEYNIPDGSLVSQTEYRELLSRVYTLEEETKKLQIHCRNLEEQRKISNDNIQKLSNIIQVHINKVSQEHNYIPANNESEKNCNLQKSSYPQLVYATLLDSVNPKGFTNASLKKIAGANLYMITIESPTEASFVLTDNIAVQHRLLMTLQNGILNNTCNFENSPFETTSQINTVESGRLVLEEGVWTIHKKIKVKFS